VLARLTMTKLLAPLLLLPLLLGCSELDNCPDEGEDITVPLGDRRSDPETGFYESSPWEGPRDPFPAKTLVRFEHGLGTTPEVVVSYVSFSDDDSDVSENAGNQGRIRCVDNTDIWIKNDTCEESFYIRVVAVASGTLDTACSCEQRFADECPK
jgi:hypothetical protein